MRLLLTHKCNTKAKKSAIKNHKNEQQQQLHVSRKRRNKNPSWLAHKKFIIADILLHYSEHSLALPDNCSRLCWQPLFVFPPKLHTQRTEWESKKRINRHNSWWYNFISLRLFPQSDKKKKKSAVWKIIISKQESERREAKIKRSSELCGFSASRLYEELKHL